MARCIAEGRQNRLDVGCAAGGAQCSRVALAGLPERIEQRTHGASVLTASISEGRGATRVVHHEPRATTRSTRMVLSMPGRNWVMLNFAAPWAMMILNVGFLNELFQ